MTRAQMKAAAKAQIKGNIGILFVISIIIVAILGVTNAILPIAGTIIVGPALSISFIRVYLNLYAGKKPEVSDTFAGFDDFWSAFKVQFFTGLFTFLWSLLFIVPGIIKAMSYSQAAKIVAENKGMPALEAIERSKKMMDGHKMEYFILTLSFIGWEILASLTCGILYIWLLPYMLATYTNFYRFLSPIAEAPVEAEAVEEAEASAEAIEAPAEEAPAEEAPAEEPKDAE